jgi:galactokinase
MPSILSPEHIHLERFQTQGSAFQAPGRVNLIGEHTDTSEGFVMPAALELRTLSVISPRHDHSAVIYSANFDESVTFDLSQLPAKPRQHWSDYAAAVLWSLAQEGVRPGGFSLTLSGDVPIGSGLSSSASVEVAVAMALLALTQTEWPKTQIARACQRAENGFIGAQSGIMDPMASCCGVADHALLLDCRSLAMEQLPLPAEAMLVICNSMVKHSVSHGSPYNQRRQEVEDGLRILQKSYPEARTLRDLTEAQLRAKQAELPEVSFRRCLHVITENARVGQAAQALRQHNLAEFGRLMGEAHRSMRDNYEASCKETDLLVELAMQQPGCFGARITGGGFGGCTVNLVEAARGAEFTDAMRAGYKAATGIDAEIYRSRVSGGAGPL